jgi:hypothetical protein
MQVIDRDYMMHQVEVDENKTIVFLLLFIDRGFGSGKMKKRCLFGIIFIITIFSLSLVFFHQYRYFYKVGDITFTFWKTRNGCYILPYKYLGITIPKNNYIKTVNTGGIIIFVCDKSKLYIFPNNIYELGADVIEVNLSSYEYKYFPYIRGIDNVLVFYEKIECYKYLGYPYINIYLREMNAKIGNDD